MNIKILYSSHGSLSSLESSATRYYFIDIIGHGYSTLRFGHQAHGFLSPLLFRYRRCPPPGGPATQRPDLYGRVCSRIGAHLAGRPGKGDCESYRR